MKEFTYLLVLMILMMVFVDNCSNRSRNTEEFENRLNNSQANNIDLETKNELGVTVKF